MGTDNESGGADTGEAGDAKVVADAGVVVAKATADTEVATSVAGAGEADGAGTCAGWRQQW